MEIAKVKQELRSLRKLNRYVDSAIARQDRYQKRLTLLRNGVQSPNTTKQIATLEKALSSLGLDRSIKELCALEKKYTDVINTFSPMDRVILMDGYVGGMSYAELGEKLGYTEEGIQKRVKKLIKKIAEKI